eukprot:jgi/Picsp_1/3436/NSC_06274-R1_trna rrna methyltransferase
MSLVICLTPFRELVSLSAGRYMLGLPAINKSIEYSRIRVTNRLVPCRSLPSYRIARKQQGSGGESRFPWENSFEISKDTVVDASTILRMLGPLMSDERKERIAHVCRRRTFNVLPIIEYPYDWGNVAAVCRTADALGCGAVHIIRKSAHDKYKQSSRTSGGAEKWLDVQLHNNGTKHCLEQAKLNGFQIVVTCLDEQAVTPDQIDWSIPTAIVFGNELEGASKEAIEMADVKCMIPIDGFVESYNISVAASLMLWEARRGRLEKIKRHGDLPEEDVSVLEAIMYLRNKGIFKQVAENLLRRPPPDWQVHRDWSAKDFLYEEDDQYNEANRGNKEKSAKEMRCHFWDGEVCYGETLGLYPKGKRCKYAAAHIPGKNTINKEKLKQRCERLAVDFPFMAKVH